VDVEPGFYNNSACFNSDSGSKFVRWNLISQLYSFEFNFSGDAAGVQFRLKPARQTIAHFTKWG
jgi:hypothetical protein